jgi:hypothetical protein
MRIKIFILLCISGVLLFSCGERIQPNIAGKWQLKTVDKEGSTTIVDTVWYNFHSKAHFSIQIYNPQEDNYRSIIGFRIQEENKMSIELGFDTVINYTDWNSRFRDFIIERNNSRKLVLRSEEGYVYFFDRF